VSISRNTFIVIQLTSQKNEHICATAACYFDDENVQAGRIDFRQPVNAARFDGLYSWCGDDGLEWLKIYGMRQGDPAVQQIGDVQTRQERIVAFSNMLHHRIRPFSLQDTTKPGHHKILTLHLVDPEHKIVSTADVPCQQREWWVKAVKATQALQKLPAEVQSLIFQNATLPLGSDEARKLRVKHMKEIKKYRQTYQVKNFENVRIELEEI
jgi:hypothetical protein